MGAKLVTVIDIVWPVVDINIVITKGTYPTFLQRLNYITFLSVSVQTAQLHLLFLWAVKFVSYCERK
jgi:hypothetical protein